MILAWKCRITKQNPLLSISLTKNTSYSYQAHSLRLQARGGGSFNMCISVCVSLSICIAYLAAIWPAKQYHESEKSDNENVLSMATMKGRRRENSKWRGTGVTIDACAKACQVLAVSLSRTLPPFPLIFPSPLSLSLSLSSVPFVILSICYKSTTSDFGMSSLCLVFFCEQAQSNNKQHSTRCPMARGLSGGGGRKREVQVLQFETQIR